MKRVLLVSALLLAGLPMTAGAMAHAGAPAMDEGGVLVGPNKMTLYTFDKDAEPGKSACNGGCATNWPPLKAAGDAKDMGPWSVVTRDDGSKQWAYKGKPVYYWAKDSKPGDKTGDGVGGVWKIATP
jgi:predicted lipoprotein with Yx(FWY)xxD motif